MGPSHVDAGNAHDHNVVIGENENPRRYDEPSAAVDRSSSGTAQTDGWLSLVKIGENKAFERHPEPGRYVAGRRSGRL